MNTDVIVITGASSGIGAALAEAAVNAGHRVVLAARREGLLRELAAKLGEHALAVPTDMTVRGEVEALCAAAVAKFGRIDVWVNNAGRGISRPVSQLSIDDLDLMVTLNVKTALYGMQAVLPHFKANKRGQIINVSSMIGRVPFVPVRSAYNGAKAMLNMLTANLRMELAEAFPEIAVTAVLPGVVATDFGNVALHGGFDSRKLPMAQPVEEVAALILAAMATRPAELYTREGMQQQVVDYYAAKDPAEVERKFAARR